MPELSFFESDPQSSNDNIAGLHHGLAVLGQATAGPASRKFVPQHSPREAHGTLSSA
jgi:hypothetical protein